MGPQFMLLFHRPNLSLNLQVFASNDFVKIYDDHLANIITYDLELLAMVFVLKIWRHYLSGVHVYIFSDY